MKSFTFYEFKLLNKNLNFCPTPKRYNKKQFKNDIDTSIRKVKLKAHFKIKNKALKTKNLETHVAKHGHQRETTTQ